MDAVEQRLAELGLQEEEEDIFDSVFEPLQHAEEDDGPAAAEEAASDISPDDMTCAICLDRTPLTDIALVKGCEHQYCVHCILQWAMCKEWCPQCKKPFDYLLCHKQLDGTLTDYLVEESVVLLKRARWFEDHMREQIAKGKAVMPTQFSSGNSTGYAAASAAHDTDVNDHRDWADYYEDYVDAELEEDEEIEQYYFSSAAGRARVVLGNRRWGEGGYLRAGRMYARPVQHTARTPNAAGGKAAKCAGKANAGSSTAEGSSSSSRAGGAGSSSSAAAAATGANRAGASSSSASSRAGGAGSSSSAAAAAASSSANAGRGRTAAAWLDDDDDYDYGDDFPYAMGGSAGGSDRRHSSSHGSSRSRSRPDRPAGMVKPLRQVPKNSPVCSMAAVPVVSPLGKSPGGGGFQCGSWGASGSGSTPGSTPGSGRRAKRNARRAAMDAGGGSGEWD